MRRCLLSLLLLGACGFDPGTTGDASPGSDAPDDVPVVASDDVVHVAAANETLGSADVVLDGATIDTSALTVGADLPAGASFAVAAADDGGPELAILHARAFTAGGEIHVTGTRPLVVLAEGIEISANFDLGGHGSTAGPGAYTGAAARGGPGDNVSLGDSGGGGGGNGTAGAVGGKTTCGGCPGAIISGGVGGAAITSGQLVGGAPGGASFAAAGTTCDVGAPGAGGGALLLYARTKITISGRVTAAGGGGRGGEKCTTPNNWLAGHGGGAGGTIVLQAPDIVNSGSLSANGGGGGAGGGQNGRGGSGDDGKIAESGPNSPAAGGPSSGQ